MRGEISMRGQRCVLRDGDEGKQEQKDRELRGKVLGLITNGSQRSGTGGRRNLAIYDRCFKKAGYKLMENTISVQQSWVGYSKVEGVEGLMHIECNALSSILLI